MTSRMCKNCGQLEDILSTVRCPGAVGTRMSHFFVEVTHESTDRYSKAVTTTPSAWDNQVGGDHYHKPGQISPFEYSMANNHNCLEFSIVKYLRKKGDKQQRLEDLAKLIDCAQKLLEWERTHECE